MAWDSLCPSPIQINRGGTQRLTDWLRRGVSIDRFTDGDIDNIVPSRLPATGQVLSSPENDLGKPIGSWARQMTRYVELSCVRYTSVLQVPVINYPQPACCYVCVCVCESVRLWFVLCDE
jgi:hypothetical protein